MTLDEECLQLFRRSRELWLVGRREEAEVIYRRIRAEHGCELGPWVDLPSLMKLVHPLGSVLGRATYAPGLVCYQGVSVGSTVEGERPTFKGACVLFPHSAVIGPVTVGANVWITAGTIVEARPGATLTVPDDSVVFSNWAQPVPMNPKHLRIVMAAARPTDRSVMATFFGEGK